MHLLRVALRVEAEVPQVAAKRSHHARVCEFRVRKSLIKSKSAGCGCFLIFQIGALPLLTARVAERTESLLRITSNAFHAI